MRKLNGGAIALVLLAITGVVPSEASAKLGIASFGMSLSSQQAGAHADQTFSFALSTNGVGNPTGQLEDATVTLPQGMVSNTQAIPRCPLATFQSFKCPPADQIGVLEASLMICQGSQQPLTVEALAGETTISVRDAAEFCAAEGEVEIGNGPDAEKATIEYVETSNNTLILSAPLAYDHAAGETVMHQAIWYPVPLSLFNLQPSPGHQATFGAKFLLASILVDVSVPSGGSSGIKATIKDASTLLGFKGATLTLWGVPSAASHDGLRCSPLLDECNLPGGESVPFTANPTDCAAPLESTLEVTSYEGESATTSAALPAMTGCEDLEVSPELSVAPETTQRDTPSGYEIDVKVPQSSQPEGLATPDIRNLSTTLPSGTTLSPGVANGLQACNEQQFTAEDCPNAAKIGTAILSTPLLPTAMDGAVYIGGPTAEEKYPLRLLLTGDGTSIRLAGHVALDPTDGQVTAIFSNAPQLPFNELKLNLFGGATAVLANPETCGPATSSVEITSYAGQTVTATSTFSVGAGGTCPSAPSFTPSFAAGTTLPLAGEYSPFTLTVARADGEPSLASFSAQLPPGLLGALGAVPRCPEPQAALGSCPQSSQVGTAVVLAGPGSQPLQVSGAVYLTGPDDGAPLGLDTVIDADAGPFDLGTAVVRSRISINPTNLQLTVTSDRFPQIMEGIPLRLKAVNITLGRPGFIFNPTSCSPATISGTVTGVSGAEAAVASPFHLEGCEALPFSPRIAADTSAGASAYGNGASLALKITMPSHGTATMRSASIQLPKQLRPRLSTLKHACLAPTAAASLSVCPAESQVGSATVTSPVMAVPLTGPVLLVAHGGSSLPSLAVLLHAEGISVELTASLSIGKRGMITTTFAALPDVPITAFQLTLPAGPRSMLGAIENVCRSTLQIPYTVTDHSAAAVTGSVRVAISGCASRTARRTRATENRTERHGGVSPAKPGRDGTAGRERTR